MPMDGCDEHPDLKSAAICASCDRGLCADCWAANVDGAPTCAACVPLLTRAVPPVVPVAGAAVALVVIARVAWIFRDGGAWIWVGAGIAAGLAVASARRLTARANEKRAARAVEERPPSPPAGGSHHPYRGAMRRAARRLAPPVSAPAAVAIVGGALVVIAAALPGAMRLPRWIELEAVLAAWWLVWTVTFAVLLYRGWRVAGDRS
jgi:hypothetical protein